MSGRSPAAWLLIAVALIAACSSGDMSSTTIGLAVTPDSVSVGIGSTAQLVAADLSGQAVQGITWSTSDATKATVSTSGLVTAGSRLAM